MPMQYYYDNVDPKSIGSYIRTARESRKLTQKTLSDDLGLDTKYLSEIERGISLPSLPLLIAISDKLEVSVQFLIRGTDEINGESISGETLFYVPEAKGIKEDDHKMILRMLKDIVKSVKKNQNKN
ncbi:helix-turn-helix domain-containing protein [Galactobacillus timonensis]|uniref:helix-turn-helix domain-containing protein n=1 Tax=Galactobacillus timonensis TaxID=2041840 RepID=UPI001436C229|nr:helix-turn-helix transcriptional regulator [Galactobacillus timonensis]